jgi:hypothetical protein
VIHTEILKELEDRRKDYYADDYLIDAAESVLKLHVEMEGYSLCLECSKDNVIPYPCPTVKAIYGELFKKDWAGNDTV